MKKFIDVVGGTQEDLYTIVNREATNPFQIPAYIYYLRKTGKYNSISTRIVGDSALIFRSCGDIIHISKPLGPKGLDMLVDIMKNEYDPHVIYFARGLSCDQKNTLLKSIDFEPMIDSTICLVNHLPALSLEGSLSGNLRRSLSTAERNNLRFEQYSPKDFSEAMELYNGWKELKGEKLSKGPFRHYNQEEMEEMLKDFGEIPGFSIYKVVDEQRRMVFIGGVFIAAQSAFPAFRLKSSKSLRQSEYHDYNVMIKLKGEGVINFYWGYSDHMIGGKMDSYKEKFIGGNYIVEFNLNNLLCIK